MTYDMDMKRNSQLLQILFYQSLVLCNLKFILTKHSFNFSLLVVVANSLRKFSSHFKKSKIVFCRSLLLSNMHLLS